MGWLDRFRNRGEADGPQPARATAESKADLEAFLDSRTGVEGFIEPPTPVYAMTLLLVAGDGEHLRRPVKHAKQAHELCGDRNVPVYDARIVGYPRRMREYEQGLRRQQAIDLDALPPLDVVDDPDHND